MSNKTNQNIIELLRSVHRDGIDNLIDFLIESDYFIAPASTKYHSNHPGGLAEHSYNVYGFLYGKNLAYKLNIPEDTIILTSLLHDLCKVDFYAIETKKIIDPVTPKKPSGFNNWIDSEVYVCKDKFPIGHGEKSVIMALKYIKLTDMEIAMIRWHMGIPSEYIAALAFNNAVKMYPSITAIMTSDMEASCFLEGVNE